MLHLKFALNLEHLADEMMTKIKECWKNPFNAPVIIFPDPKLEQWFRLHWIKKQGTAAGLNTKMIDSFLMEILVGEKEEKQKLGVEMLRNVILAYIYQNKDNLLDIDQSGEVARYLKNENGELDENRLFDFAGKMASLFLEYETSRPSNYKFRPDGSAPGILECWSQEELKFFFTNSNQADIRKTEIWQRNLYSKIFHNPDENNISLLSKVFKKVNDKRNEGKSIRKDITYLTLPFLFKFKTGYNCKKFLGPDGEPLPVFIFGLTGMGQFYRIILQDFAQQPNTNVHAYIQNPCMEFWEDLNSDRQKIRQWNRKAGKWLASNASNANLASDEDIRKIGEKLVLDLQEYNEDYEANVNSSNENALLCYWGKTGRDNIKLWCAASDYDFEFDEKGQELPENPSLLQIVQHMVASRSNKSTDLLKKFESDCSTSGALANDNTFSLTGAPTKIREMEVLHSRICKLLQEGAHVSDILVVSPNLDDYRTAIYQAFDQNERGKDKNGKNKFHVPFSIVDSPARNSLTGNALEALFSILAGGTITRPAFFNLVRNPVVQIARHIDNDEVDAWENWVENLNIYRDRNIIQKDKEYYKTDWTNGIRRMLLSRFTNCNVQFDDNNELLPYSDIDSSNNGSLCKFVECINDLEEIIDFKNKNTGIPEEKLNDFMDFIGGFLAMTNPPDGFGGENIIYQNVVAAFDNLRCQYYAGVKNITWECLHATLCGTAQSSAYSCGNLFVNGITFCKFISNRIIPVKHLFFIGADSKSFPGTKPSGMMDLRRAVPAWPGDDSPVAKLRYAFLCQFMSTSCGFHISYVNKDIVKDEEFYPTSIVNDIRSFFKNSIQNTVSDSGTNFEEWKDKDQHKNALKNIWPEIKISLDENRPYTELFTEREFRNKKLLNSKPAGKPHPSANEDYADNKNPPDRITQSQLKNFLSDPFQFRISCMMQRDDNNENDVDPEDVLYEPIDFNNLGHSILVNKKVAARISPETGKDLFDFERELELKGIYPDGIFRDRLDAIADKKCRNVINQMDSEKELPCSPLHNKENWTFHKKMDDFMIESGGKEFVLTGSADFWDGENNFASITSSAIDSKGDTRKGTKIFFAKSSKFLPNYIRALIRIAQNDTTETQTANLAIYSSNGGATPSGKATVTATSAEARETLAEIIQLAFQKNYSKCVPVDLLDEVFKDFFEFEDKLDSKHGPWTYFGKKHLFDKKRDLGYDPLHKDFVTFASDNSEEPSMTGGEWFDAVTQQKRLLRHLNVIEEPSPDNKVPKAEDGDAKPKATSKPRPKKTGK